MDEDGRESAPGFSDEPGRREVKGVDLEQWGPSLWVPLVPQPFGAVVQSFPATGAVE